MDDGEDLYTKAINDMCSKGLPDDNYSINELRNEYFNNLKPQINDILIKGIGNGLFIDLIMADSVSNLEQIEGYEERVKQKADNLINSIDEQLKITIDSNINVDDTATEFFSWFFGPCFTAVSEGKNIRETYEYLNPTKQCTESFKIRDLTTLFEGGFSKEIYSKFPIISELAEPHMCYICGKEITSDHESPECEHIVDAFTGIGIGSIIQESNCYKILYKELDDFLNENEKTDKENSVYLENLKRILNTIGLYICEYSNSHRCCNRIKSRDIWIRHDGTNWYIDEAGIDETLTNIINSSRTLHDCGNIFYGMSKTSKDLLKLEQISKIKVNYLTPLISILNNQRIESSNQSLKFRCNQLLSLKINMDRVITSIITGTMPTSDPLKKKVSVIKPITFSNRIRKNILSESMDNIKIKLDEIFDAKTNDSRPLFYSKFVLNGGRHRVNNKTIFSKNMYDFFYKDHIIKLCNQLENYITTLESDTELGKMTESNISKITTDFMGLLSDDNYYKILDESDIENKRSEEIHAVIDVINKGFMDSVKILFSETRGGVKNKLIKSNNKKNNKIISKKGGSPLDDIIMEIRTYENCNKVFNKYIDDTAKKLVTGQIAANYNEVLKEKARLFFRSLLLDRKYYYVDRHNDSDVDKIISNIDTNIDDLYRIIMDHAIKMTPILEKLSTPPHAKAVSQPMSLSKPNQEVFLPPPPSTPTKTKAVPQSMSPSNISYERGFFKPPPISPTNKMISQDDSRVINIKLDPNKTRKRRREELIENEITKKRNNLLGNDVNNINNEMVISGGMKNKITRKNYKKSHFTLKNKKKSSKTLKNYKTRK